MAWPNFVSGLGLGERQLGDYEICLGRGGGQEEEAALLTYAHNVGLVIQESSLMLFNSFHSHAKNERSPEDCRQMLEFVHQCSEPAVFGWCAGLFFIF